jgi:molybdopterin synthase catalytic subunit
MVLITAEPIDPTAAYSMINASGAGSVVFHYAVVKSLSGSDGQTSHIDYAATEGTEEELAQISARLANEFSISDVLLIRRAGTLGVGDIISLVAASSPNSEDAFEACRQGIAMLKKMKTIRKQEVFS